MTGAVTEAERASATGAFSAKTLSASGVTVQFAGVRAVDGVDLTVDRGEIVGLIGPNGAGKTTLVNAITGFVKPQAGRITITCAPVASGSDPVVLDVTRRKCHSLARVGIVRTFQAVRLFGRFTIAGNVEAALVGVGVRGAEVKRRTQAALEMVNLADQGDTPASAVPSGTARLAGVARAVAVQPDFLLLDEPAAGLNDDENDGLVEVIVRIRDRVHCGIVLIEHDMRVVMPVCDRIQVLNYGQTIKVGTLAEVRADPVVREAYLGDPR
jgi:ABC-type branched-subunit amino acid transport system ATPase component